MKPQATAKLIRAALPDGEAMVQADGHKRALLINAVADVILDLCDGTRTVAEIANILRATLRIPAGADVEGDVARLVAELMRAGIVQSSPEPADS